MTKAIIFDLWKTLAEKPKSISGTLKAKFDINFEMHHYEETVQLKEWTNPQELAQKFLARFKAAQTKENIDFVVSTFTEVTNGAELYSGIKQLLEELSKNYSLAILSNTTNYEVVKKEWKIDNNFKVIAYSYKTGCLKPSKSSFLYVCEKLRTKPEDCIFIDDTEKNVEAAKEIGIDGVKYENLKQLKQELKKRGIYPVKKSTA